MSIVIRDIKKNFGSLPVLKGINAEFKENQITGFIGFNGSGKSTTFNIMANYIEEYEGTVLFNGKKWNTEIGKTISYLASGAEPKNRQKSMNHLLDIAFMYEMPRNEARAKIIELAKVLEFSQFLPRRIGQLSAGNQQKIKLITALMNPKLKYLFLDEPFDALDPIMTRKIEAVIMKLKGITTIITSHRMEIVQNMCSSYYIIKEGNIVDALRNEDLPVTIVVNAEVDVEKCRGMDGVVSIAAKDHEKLITLSDISHFKAVNLVLIKDSGYVYSSIKDRNLAMSVFEKYADQKEGVN